MRFIVIGNVEQLELLKSATGTANEWILNDSTINDADAFFYLNNDVASQPTISTDKPVFINSVIDTLAELQAAKNTFRINAWPTFFERSSWEIAGEITPAVELVLEQIGKKAIVVADEPGLIAARVVAAIINEAYFGLADEISSRSEIDTAMKLGTNYPYGPFEWAEKAGLQNIHALLKKMSIADERYTPAPLLTKEASDL